MGAYPSALTRALRRGDLPSLRRLLARHGSSVLDAPPGGGVTALQRIFEESLPEQIALLPELLAHGANPNVRSPHGMPHQRSPGNPPLLVWLASCTAPHIRTLGATSCLRALLEHGAHANAADNDGITAAHVAAAKPCLDDLEALRTHGADLARRDALGRTPLHFAALYAKPATHAIRAVRWLVETGADPCATDDSGADPLMVCAAQGRTALADELIRLGNSPLRRDSLGLSASAHARAHGHDALADCLDAAARRLRLEPPAPPEAPATNQGPQL